MTDDVLWREFQLARRCALTLSALRGDPTVAWLRVMMACAAMEGRLVDIDRRVGWPQISLNGQAA